MRSTGGQHEGGQATLSSFLFPAALGLGGGAPASLVPARGPQLPGPGSNSHPCIGRQVLRPWTARDDSRQAV